MRCQRFNVLILPLSSTVRNNRMFPLLSLSGPVLVVPRFPRRALLFFTGGGLKRSRNADFFFPLEIVAPLVLTEGLAFFVSGCAKDCVYVAVKNKQQSRHIHSAQSLYENFQWRNYRSLKAFCFAFKIGFNR